MKIITAIHDGKINSTGFKNWEDARLFVISRIPEEAFVRIDKTHPYASKDLWVKLEYAEFKKDGSYKIHVWELNEVSVTSSRSS